MVALIIVSFQGIIYVAAMLTSPCSPPLFACYAEILTRTSTEHDIEIRHNLLIGFGNISDVKGGINTMNGAFYTHLHMSAGNDKGEVFGGHLNRAVVSATCEMVVDVLDGTVDRQYDPVTGLNLFKF